LTPISRTETVENKNQYRWQFVARRNKSRVAQEVYAYNKATGEIGAYPITDVISHVDPEIVLLTIDGETLETTAEHPFYELESAPWLAVGQTAGR